MHIEVCCLLRLNRRIMHTQAHYPQMPLQKVKPPMQRENN